MGPKSILSLLPKSSSRTASSFEENFESVLNRSSGNPSPYSSDLTSAQKQVDEMTSRFVHEASDWKSLAAMMVGGVAFRLGKIGVITGSEKILGSFATRLFPLVQAASALGGLAGEVTVFEGVNELLSPSLPPKSYGKRWLSSFINFGTLKGFGKFAEGQNIFVQHAIQDMGMVLGHHVAHGSGVEEKPEGSLVEQLLRSEIANIQWTAGTQLAHYLTGGNLMAFERGLELTLQAKVFENKMHRNLSDLWSPQLAFAEGNEKAGVEGTAPKKALDHPLVILSQKNEKAEGSDGKTSKFEPPLFHKSKYWRVIRAERDDKSTGWILTAKWQGETVEFYDTIKEIRQAKRVCEVFDVKIDFRNKTITYPDATGLNARRPPGFPLRLWTPRLSRGEIDETNGEVELEVYLSHLAKRPPETPMSEGPLHFHDVFDHFIEEDALMYPTRLGRRSLAIYRKTAWLLTEARRGIRSRGDPSELVSLWRGIAKEYADSFDVNARGLKELWKGTSMLAGNEGWNAFSQKFYYQSFHTFQELGLINHLRPLQALDSSWKILGAKKDAQTAEWVFTAQYLGNRPLEEELPFSRETFSAAGITTDLARRQVSYPGNMRGLNRNLAEAGASFRIWNPHPPRLGVDLIQKNPVEYFVRLAKETPELPLHNLAYDPGQARVVYRMLETVQAGQRMIETDPEIWDLLRSTSQGVVRRDLELGEEAKALFSPHRSWSSHLFFAQHSIQHELFWWDLHGEKCFEDLRKVLDKLNRDIGMP
ncbi:MAG: hypothetical protein U1F57_06530 [bacterium]